MTDLFAALVYFALAIGVLILTAKLLSGNATERFVQVTTAPYPIPVPIYTPHSADPPPYDPCDHPFAELPLNDLLTHLHEEHFEVWNLLGETNPLPSRWRKEHAADHGGA